MLENPKAVQGRMKPEFHYMPLSGLDSIFTCLQNLGSTEYLYKISSEVAMAMAEGAKKYGVMKWRDVALEKVDYYNAAMRHIISSISGEVLDPESGINHLSKAIAGIIIYEDYKIGANYTESAYDQEPCSVSPFDSQLSPGSNILLILRAWLDCEKMSSQDVIPEIIKMRISQEQ